MLDLASFLDDLKQLPQNHRELDGNRPKKSCIVDRQQMIALLTQAHYLPSGLCRLWDCRFSIES